MCGRFVFTPRKDFYDLFDVEEEYRGLQLRDNYNVAPGQEQPIITRNSPNQAKVMRWGLIPSWAKDKRIGYKMINARAEGIESKPSFRHAFKKQRCLVPASGFYEWRKHGGDKKPFFIHPTDQDMFAFAGLWEYWQDKSSGEEIVSFTIITTEPNTLMKSIHDRMPVILHRDDYEQWLDNERYDEDALLKLLKSYPDKDMDMYEISTEVNSPKNNSKELLEPVKEDGALL